MSSFNFRCFVLIKISLMDPLERKRSREKIEREKKEEESRGLGVGSIEHSGMSPFFFLLEP